jgi:hypothetical protein
MNDHIEQERAATDPITKAMRAYPLAPTPPGLNAAILARLSALPAGVRPKFRLRWYDYAISAFTSGMAGLGILIWQSLPPQTIARLQIDLMLLSHRLAQFMPGIPGLGQ